MEDPFERRPGPTMPQPTILTSKHAHDHDVMIMFMLSFVTCFLCYDSNSMIIYTTIQLTQSPTKLWV